MRLGVKAALVDGQLVDGDVEVEDGVITRLGVAPAGAEGPETQGEDATPPEAAQPPPLAEEIVMLDQALAASAAAPRARLRDALIIAPHSVRPSHQR